MLQPHHNLRRNNHKFLVTLSLPCFDTAGWASGLKKFPLQQLLGTFLTWSNTGKVSKLNKNGK